MQVRFESRRNRCCRSSDQRLFLLCSRVSSGLRVSVVELEICDLVANRANLRLRLLLGLLAGSEDDVGEVVEVLVGRERELALAVDDALSALLGLLGRGLAGCRAKRAGREIDPELLRGAEQLVV